MIKSILYSFVLFTLLVLFSSGAHALKTEVTVKTEPYHSLFVQVANPNDDSVLGKYFNKTDVAGTIKFDFSTTLSLKELTFFVMTRHPITKEVVYETWFNDIPIDEEMFLNVLEEEGVEDYTLPESENDSAEENISNNETASEETIEDNIEEQQDLQEDSTKELKTQKSQSFKGISGFFISEETGKISKNVYYIGAVVIVLAFIIFFFVYKRSYTMPSQQSIPQPKPQQLSQNRVFGLFRKPSIEQRLEDAQRKIREAQTEIRKIKEGGLVELKKTKEIEQAKIEFEKAKEKLEKLTGNSLVEEKQKTQRRISTTDEAKYRKFQNK